MCFALSRDCIKQIENNQFLQILHPKNNSDQLKHEKSNEDQFYLRNLEKALSITKFYTKYRCSIKGSTGQTVYV